MTQKQARWLKTYMETGDNQLAAHEGYGVSLETRESRAYASSLSWRNKKSQAVSRNIESSVDLASKTITFLATHADNERVRLAAAQDILDRLGFKAPEKIELDDKRTLLPEDYDAIRRVQSILAGTPIREAEVVEITTNEDEHKDGHED